MRILVILIAIIFSTPAFAVSEEHAKQYYSQCINGGGSGLQFFKEAQSDSCHDYLKGRKEPVYETDAMKQKLLGSCECKGKNQCWSDVDKSCVSYKKACKASLLATCENELKYKTERYEKQCPAHCRPGYVPTEADKKEQESDLCKHSNHCTSKLPCFMKEPECDISFKNMCKEIIDKCDSMPE